MTDGSGTPDASGALTLIGVIRMSEVEQRLSALPGDLQRLPFRDIAALVIACDSDGADLQPAHVVEHNSALEKVMDSRTVIPAAPGVIFESSLAAREFLKARYLPLREALGVVDGRCEFRLHIRGVVGVLDEASPDIYRELRQLAHSSMSLVKPDQNTFSAGFLVDRASTRQFVGRVEELAAENPDISLDLTGPWPPYDFVLIRA
ncbi:MAG TPA: GvpL/GvpF family gas vesicle protein [Longimicrobiaceae bacterium]|nr:GvpL/GvpF family gas vesicle protein [Longimicrobiaceae bacterium]